MSEPVLKLDGVDRIYRQAGRSLQVLRGVSLSIGKGEMVALVGPSGAGKSTLLHLAGLLEQPDAGEVYVLGRACGGLSDLDRTQVRRSDLGFIYQFHHLLPEFSALENVELPQMMLGIGRRAAAQRAGELLAAVGLAERHDHRPARLSGGEQQRVAVARALANRPKLLLADEPTGNLDTHTADEVFGIFCGLVKDSGLGALVATHNRELADRMDRVLTLVDGRIEVLRG